MSSLAYVTKVLARRTKNPARSEVPEEALHEALLYNIVKQTDLKRSVEYQGCL